MATGDDFRAIALSLPGVIEKPHFDRTSFRVDGRGGKTLATMLADGSSANLVLTPEEQDMLCTAEPSLFAPVPNKWGEKGWTTLTLAYADQATLQSASRMAWRHAAPEKLKTANPAV